ncbi:hypothetical protein HS088_TW05G00742 [Tripterygium wilfordii]|uniref:Uncharacterized protein n=1 Tax=Tripterygium wilfordii TaxID=458696 RepID=A0A7J7DNR5_TRIWF|nr:uncharacterized protein LOC119998781 [Tripterygium wilfordii]KAF5748010.1 hypothetical protein HS088_TW05G00742 [Tripterygium wilfordii]
MAETNGSLQQIHQKNPTLQSLFHALDPISLILSQNSNPYEPVPLRLTTECYIMERGPRYKAYAELRELKFRMKNARPQENYEEEFKQNPPKKQVKFQGNVIGIGRKGSSSILAQSVPDFSAVIRKENRKPLSTMTELTPPPPSSKNWAKMDRTSSSSRGSKSANAGEKKRGMLMARKSYASIEELKGSSAAVANAINGENRGGGRGIGKTVLGSKQFRV